MKDTRLRGTLLLALTATLVIGSFVPASAQGDLRSFPCRSELRLYDFTLLFDVVTIAGLPAFITRAVWVNPSSELLRIEMPKPATRIPAMRATITTFRWVVRSAL